MDTEQYREPEMSQVFSDTLERQFIPVTKGKRLANFIIDRIAIFGLLYGLAYADATCGTGLFYEMMEGESNFIYEYVTSWIVVGIVYSIMEGIMGGRSVGKLFTGTRAVRKDGSAFTFKDAIGRSFARMIPFNELSIFFGEPWHDRLTKTTVVYNKPQ